MNSLSDVEDCRNDFLRGIDEQRDMGCIAKERHSHELRDGFIFGNSYMLYGLQNDPAGAEFVSIDNLLFLLWGQRRTLGRHTAYVDDFVKVSNFKALYPCLERPEDVVRALADQKVKGLDAIAEAHAPLVGIRRFSDFTGCNDLFHDVLERLDVLYDTDASFREEVMSLVPVRLKEGMDGERLMFLADYAMQELAMILSNSSVKVGPVTERGYDSLCISLSDTVGRRKSDSSFRYPYAGAPYTTPLGVIEPYNVTNPAYRVLITDTAEDIEEKADSIHEKQGLNERRRFDNHLLMMFQRIRDRKFFGTMFYMFTPSWHVSRDDFYRRFHDKVLAPIQANL